MVFIYFGMFVIAVVVTKRENIFVTSFSIQFHFKVSYLAFSIVFLIDKIYKYGFVHSQDTLSIKSFESFIYNPRFELFDLL